MPDDRIGAPEGPPGPFGRAGGTNGVPRNGARLDGSHRGSVDLSTRPLSVDVAEGPIDLAAMQADDELVNALGAGAAVTYGDHASGSDSDLRRHRDERLVAMLAAWRAEIEAEPIPELVDLDTAVAAVVSGMKADAGGARRRRAHRLRHLAPLAAAAALIVATVSGVGLGSQNAMPGDTLWPIQKVVNPERVESVETKLEVESRLQTMREELSNGDRAAAERQAAVIRTKIRDVRDEDGQTNLRQEQESLEAELARTPADLTAPPPPLASTSPGSDDPSVLNPDDPDPRGREESEGPAAGSASEAPATGSPAPEVTKPPSESKPALENGEGSSDLSTAPGNSGDQPASVGGTSGPSSGSTQNGNTTASGIPGSGTRASGSAGMRFDGTATASNPS